MAAKTAPMLNAGTGAPDYVAKVQGLRRSSAAGTHQPKATRRARTRSTARRRAIGRDLSSG